MKPIFVVLILLLVINACKKPKYISLTQQDELLMNDDDTLKYTNSAGDTVIYYLQDNLRYSGNKDNVPTRDPTKIYEWHELVYSDGNSDTLRLFVKRGIMSYSLNNEIWQLGYLSINPNYPYNLEIEPNTSSNFILLNNYTTNGNTYPTAISLTDEYFVRYRTVIVAPQRGILEYIETNGIKWSRI